MFLFKAAATTYSKVVNRHLHAFPFSPTDVQGDEFILLSKNAADCAPTEPQVQYIAKLLRVRAATPKELDENFPGVRAADRWNYVVELYWTRRLDAPFSLSGVPGLRAQRYNPVQGFARLDEQDAAAIVAHLSRTNTAMLLDVINNAERPS